MSNVIQPGAQTNERCYFCQMDASPDQLLGLHQNIHGVNIHGVHPECGWAMINHGIDVCPLCRAPLTPEDRARFTVLHAAVVPAADDDIDYSRAPRFASLFPETYDTGIA